MQNKYFTTPIYYVNDKPHKKDVLQSRNSQKEYGKEGLDIGDPKLTIDMKELLVKEKFEVNHDMSFLDPQWQITINEYFDSIHNLGILIFKAIISSY